MTYRQRREAKAARLRGWAEARVERAEATLAADERFRGDYAFNTQPGHIPERARVIAREDRAYASMRKAAEMTARADGIEAQAAAAIYSDDPDAIERLREKLSRLEAERAAIVAFNKAVRAKGADAVAIVSALPPDLLADWKRTRYGYCKDAGFPAYATSNLSGNISRLRERIARLEAALP